MIWTNCAQYFLGKRAFEVISYCFGQIVSTFTSDSSKFLRFKFDSTKKDCPSVSEILQFLHLRGTLLTSRTNKSSGWGQVTDGHRD